MSRSKWVRTADGSLTLFNEASCESYHSVTGAFEESFRKFVLPAFEIVDKPDIVVFDICFGLGYNTAACLHWFLENSDGGFMKVFGFEADDAILTEISKVKVPEEISEAYKGVRASAKRVLMCDEFSLEIIRGDARKTLLNMHCKADIVLFDPFSPKKAPGLWEEGFLREVYNRMNPGGVLTTYSCARFVRDNLRACGFMVCDGPAVGRRGPSTIAVKVGNIFK